MTRKKNIKKLWSQAKKLALIGRIKKEIEKDLKIEQRIAQIEASKEGKQLDITRYHPGYFKFKDGEASKINNYLNFLIESASLMGAVKNYGRSIYFGEIPLAGKTPRSYNGYLGLFLSPLMKLGISCRELQFMADHPWETETENYDLFSIDFAGRHVICYRESPTNIEVAANVIRKYGEFDFELKKYPKKLRKRISAHYLRKKFNEAVEEIIRKENLPELKKELIELEERLENYFSGYT